MKKIMMILFSLLAVVMIVGCVTPAPQVEDLSEDEVSAELEELDELEQQSEELDDVSFDEAEEAVAE